MIGGHIGCDDRAVSDVPVEILDQLEACHDLTAVGQVVRRAARALTGALGATFVLREGEYCFYADEDAIAPLWKGQRFPMTSCISGWAMLNDETALVPDIEVDPRIPLEAYRPTFVRSLVMAPVRSPEPVAAIGAYWSTSRHTNPDEVQRLEALAAAVGATIARIGLDGAPWAPSFSVRTRSRA